MDILLTDRENNVFGRIKIKTVKGNLHIGEFFPENFPKVIRHLCDEYQDLAESQVFSLLDDIEAQLETFGMQVRIPGTPDAIPIHSLQITRDNKISYRLPQ